MFTFPIIAINRKDEKPEDFESMAQYMLWERNETSSFMEFFFLKSPEDMAILHSKYITRRALPKFFGGTNGDGSDRKQLLRKRHPKYSQLLQELIQQGGPANSRRRSLFPRKKTTFLDIKNEEESGSAMPSVLKRLFSVKVPNKQTHERTQSGRYLMSSRGTSLALNPERLSKDSIFRSNIALK
mmetsp:Transcript_16505/g.25954  ORF Transcript_16505/g.25954 Transcript_16505/m.25954 type:complete len:184 (-) Transcript_16505:790-1341(-)